MATNKRRKAVSKSETKRWAVMARFNAEEKKAFLAVAKKLKEPFMGNVLRRLVLDKYQELRS